MPEARTPSQPTDTPKRWTTTAAFAAWESGKTNSMATEMKDLSPELQRFAFLLLHAVEDVADETGVSEGGGSQHGLPNDSGRHAAGAKSAKGAA